ncbi:hypothetical protein FSP39_010435 [Pinctada imbricata]|uniref:Protein sleepless n=1 Tax=Pinctada imbricata TaxID=66713 RepID=A0AA88YC29_PINIB|nr:hypothetical protein FSP39_010435 [Pinctada imbricata]
MQVTISLQHTPLCLLSADSIMCHRCFSAMGGCGDNLDWRMFPWKDCGDSQFCVKVIEKVGSEMTIIRECENVLQKSTKHRLKMPNLRRHGYCEPGRKNDKYNPLVTTTSKVKYCFCNDWNGCNTADRLATKFVPLAFLSLVMTLFLRKFT